MLLVMLLVCFEPRLLQSFKIENQRGVMLAVADPRGVGGGWGGKAGGGGRGGGILMQ